MGQNKVKIATITCVHRADDIRVVWKECRALATEFDLTLIAPAGPLPSAGVDFKFAPIRSRRSRWSRVLLGPVDCFRELQRGGYGVIHAHDPELLPLLCLWKTMHPRSVVIYDAHESFPEQIAGKHYIPEWLRPMAAALATALLFVAVRKIDGVVAATPKIAESLVGTRTTKVVAVQNFPWLKDYPEPTHLGTAVEPSLCYVGAISEARGRGAMEELASRLGEARVVVAGQDGIGLSREAKEATSVEYVGAIASSSVPSFLAQHSVGLALLQPLPNYLWSQPTKVFEYMASARPFIASDLPRWRELFGNLGAGVLVDPTNPEEIEAAARKLLYTPGLARECGLRGRRAMADKFSFEIEANKLVDFYYELLTPSES